MIIYLPRCVTGMLSPVENILVSRDDESFSLEMLRALAIMSLKNTTFF